MKLMGHPIGDSSFDLVTTFLLTLLALLFQLTPVLFGVPFTFLTILSVIPFYLILSKNMKYGIYSVISVFLISFLFSSKFAFLFIFTNAPIALVLGIAANKKLPQLMSIISLGLLLSATLICVEQFLSLTVFILNPESPFIYIGWALLFSMMISILIHLALYVGKRFVSARM